MCHSYPADFGQSTSRPVPSRRRAGDGCRYLYQGRVRWLPPKLVWCLRWLHPVVFSSGTGAGTGTGTRPLLGLLQKGAGLGAEGSVVIAVAEADGLFQFYARDGTVGLERQLAELQVRASMHPSATFDRERLSQILLCLGGAPRCSARDA